MYALCMAPGGLPRSGLATDFSEYAIGVGLSAQGWTYSSATAFTMVPVASEDLVGGKRVQVQKLTSDGGRFATLDAVGTVSDVEILALVKLTAAPTGAGETIAQIIARMANITHYYVALPRNISAGTTKIFEIGKEAGSGAAALDNTPFTWDELNLFWIRLRIVGSALSAKMWSFLAAEPGSWMVTATDSSNASGKVGLGAFYQSSIYRCAFYSVALGGATAPGLSG